MKINYFVLYPNNTYEFVEKEIPSNGITYLSCIQEDVGDFCWFVPLEHYPGYFIAFNDCTADCNKPNKLAQIFTDKEEIDVCVLVKCFTGQASSDDEFETFNDEDRKYFELILNEQIKVINNESNKN